MGEWSSTVFDGFALDDAEEVLARVRPDVVVCCASEQSPYEKRTHPTQWTELIGRGGFGLTLPLQARLVARAGPELDRGSPHALLVNGCFPDAVNPLLAALGLPVHCGIGNVATLAACLQAALGLPASAGWRCSATTPTSTRRRPGRRGAGLAGRQPDARRHRAAGRRPRAAPPGAQRLAGHAAARLLLDLLAGEEIHTNLPGPLGLPGGYPVRIAAATIALNLPAGAQPRRRPSTGTSAPADRDGVEVGDGRVGYTAGGGRCAGPHLPDIAAGWPPRRSTR